MSPPAAVPAWEVLSRRLVLDDPWLRVRAERCRLPDGHVIDPYYVLDGADWVHVHALDDQGRLVLVRQYRHGIGRDGLELPGGLVDPGETPLEAARRELREETGLVARTWIAAGTRHPNPARQSNAVHLFLARGLHEDGPPRLDHGESLTCEWHTPASLDAVIADGQLHNACHLGLLHLAEHVQRRGAGTPARA